MSKDLFGQFVDYFDDRFLHYVDPLAQLKFWGQNWWLSLVISAVYLATIFGIQFLLRDPSHKGWKLKLPHILWNAILALFSTMGAYVTLPYMINSLRRKGYFGTICENQEYYFSQDSIAVWSLLFALSKIPELVDTYFIVLQKRPLIFLHWYHHISVMIYGFYQTHSFESTGAPYMMMNYCVHSVMYTYYTVTATGHRFPRWVAQIVTTMQLTQMTLGLIIVISTVYFKATSDCPGCTWPKLAGAVAMYVSYFWLFATLYTRYFRDDKDKKRKKGDGKGEKVDKLEDSKNLDAEGTPTSVLKKDSATPAKRTSKKI